MYKKLKILIISILILIVLTFSFYRVYKLFSAFTSLLTSLIVIIALYQFLSDWKRKQLGNIKIESAQFARTYVLRAYVKAKNLWIFFDKKMKLFRPAGSGDVPVRVFLIILLGIAFIYIAYLILFTIAQVVELLLFRALVLFIIVVIGFYALFIGIARILSLGNKNVDKICRFLNKNKSLKDFMVREKAYMQITPNFLVSGGSVTSIEFILPSKPGDKKIEKILIGIAREVNKLK